MPYCRQFVRFGSTSFGLLALYGMVGNAHAQEITIYGALTSDYVYRGISNSDEHAAAQLAFDISTESGIFGGVWSSTMDISSGDRKRSLEVDYYLGYVRYFENDWSASVSVNRTTYPGADGNVSYNYNELATVVGFDDRFWVEVNYTDSLFGHGESAYNVEILANWPLPASLTLSTVLGHNDVSNIAGSAYSHWQVGVSRPLGWAIVDLRYHDTSNVPTQFSPANLADPRVVLTLSAAF